LDLPTASIWEANWRLSVAEGKDSNQNIDFLVILCKSNSKLMPLPPPVRMKMALLPRISTLEQLLFEGYEYAYNITLSST